jgi:hypothetical protein
MTEGRATYPPLLIVKQVCKDLGWTYEDLARKTQKITGTDVPGANYVAQCVCGVRRFGPDTAEAIEKATRGRLKKEWLVWPGEAPEPEVKVSAR